MYILGALNKQTNQYILPNKAEKNVEYICIDCKQKVIFRKGEVRVAHFAHYSPTNNCSYYEHPNESQLHKDAKYKLADWLKNKMKIIIDFDCPECSSSPSQDEVNIEYKRR
jgi:competence CoiA-like predicted nuclease